MFRRVKSNLVPLRFCDDLTEMFLKSMKIGQNSKKIDT
jgi:hypothetical protein